MNTQQQSEYVQQIAAIQSRLHRYVLTMLPNRADAADVLQEANLVLWQKADQFTPDTNFSAWAHKIAYFQALRFIEKRRRGGWLQFNDELIEKISVIRQSDEDHEELRMAALAGCLQKLPERDRALVLYRYQKNGRLSEFVDQAKRSTVALRQALFRCRSVLRTCIDLSLKEAEA